MNKIIKISNFNRTENLLIDYKLDINLSILMYMSGIGIAFRPPRLPILFSGRHLLSFNSIVRATTYIIEQTLKTINASLNGKILRRDRQYNLFMS